MGNRNSSQQQRQREQDTLRAYLSGQKSLQEVWHQFDQDGNGVIDLDELEHLIYTALVFFCHERDRDMPAPSLESCKPFVKKIISDLQPRLDQNGDNEIDMQEFEAFGEYLKNEYRKLLDELHNAS